MADNLTATAENLALDWLTGVGTPTRPTTPLKVALVTTLGTDTAAGTEVTGGTYTRQDLTVAAGVNGATANAADIIFTGMPATTVVGVEVWDSATTPVRLWYGPLTTERTTAAGDDSRFLAGDLTLALS